jgi:hypothetical protein
MRLPCRGIGLGLSGVCGKSIMSFSTSTEQAKQGADTRPETSEVDAPPEGAGRHGDRMLVGHSGTEDCPQRSQGNSAEPES